MEMFKNYNYNVRIFQKYGNGYRVVLDKGRRVDLKTSATMLRLKKLKKDIEFPEFKYVYSTDGKTQCIDYFSMASGEYRAMDIDETTDKRGNVISKKPVEKDVQLWYINDYHRIQEKYKKEEGLLSKLLPYIGLGITVGLIAFVAIFTYNGLVDIANAAGSSAAAAERASAHFEEFARIMERAVGSAAVQQTVVSVPTTPNIG